MTLSATLTVTAAAQRPWDVVVIGAGPAGALAARQLTLSGARTLLIDRSSFPRRKVCGACLNGQALAILQSAGLGDLVSRLGGRPLARYEVRSEHCGFGLTLPSGAAVSRTRLDAALVQAAAAAGAEFLPGTTARVCRRTMADRYRAVELTETHSPRPAGVVQAGIVLAAGGLGQGRWLPREEFRCRTSARSRIGLGAVLATADGYEPGTIYMALGRAGYVGLVRTEGATLNVAAAVDPEYVRRRKGPGAAVAELLKDTGLPAIPDLHDAVWTGTAPLTHRTRPLAGERVLLLGDAAEYVEPFTGEGIGWALAGAREVVPLALQAIAAWDVRLGRLWERIYRRRFAGRYRLCRIIAAGVRFPRMACCVLKALSCSPLLAGPVIRRISGLPARLEGSC